LVAATALLLVAGLIAAHPLRRFEQFKHNVQPESVDPGNFTNAHLFGSGGNGRWQMWSAAGHQWQQHPIVGNGAGSFAEWWTRHGTISVHILNAHSLYLQILGELGLVGFLILAQFFLVGAIAAIRRSLVPGDKRITTAALTAVFIAYSVAIAADWMWELTVVSVVAWTVLALALCSPEPLEQASKPKTARKVTRLLRRNGPIAATVAIAWLLIAAQTIPLLARMQIEKSQAAVARGDAAAAESAALKARRIQPWAASPALQLALVLEEEGKLVHANAWIREAIKHDETNWDLWLASARIDVKRGKIASAKMSLMRAIELNPRSPRVMHLKQILSKKAP
ncbi:MAG: O-antigen ligase family protein, partial [Gaiellaceae bacterium]